MLEHEYFVELVLFQVPGTPRVRVLTLMDKKYLPRCCCGCGVRRQKTPKTRHRSGRFARLEAITEYCWHDTGDEYLVLSLRNTAAYTSTSNIPLASVVEYVLALVIPAGSNTDGEVQ